MPKLATVSYLVFSLISITFWLILVPLAVFFGLSSTLGAPYVPVRKADTDDILNLLDLKPGDTLVDLGAGDGKLLRAAAKRGIKGIGYEVNPALFGWSWLLCRRYRKLITLHLGNYWKLKLPPAQGIYFFLIGHYMEKMEQKLRTEVGQPTRVVSYIFELPGHQPIEKSYNAYLYVFGG